MAQYSTDKVFYQDVDFASSEAESVSTNGDSVVFLNPPDTVHIDYIYLTSSADREAHERLREQYESAKIGSLFSFTSSSKGADNGTWTYNYADGERFGQVIVRLDYADENDEAHFETQIIPS